jgi:hypothetical protein
MCEEKTVKYMASTIDTQLQIYYFELYKALTF